MRGGKWLLLSSVALMYGPQAMAQSAKGAETGDGGIADIVVTAQKRAENLQDVPIAVSAFSQEALQSRGLVGGNDLKQAIPNVSFSNTGFGRYNFQIRGIGAQVQGASVDTGVGIHENNIPLTANHLAEAEFFDVERVEVLRGPQGTLYGRNATGGVVNIITAKPVDHFAAEITGEYGNFDTRRLRGYVNVPLTDTIAVRAAGTMIKRDGMYYNEGTGHQIDSRDIWSGRLTARWEPSDRFNATAMWEHFEENDTRGGGQKIICATDPGPATIGGVPTDPTTRLFLSNGCRNTAIGDPANNGAVPSTSTIPGLFALLFGLQNGDAFAGRTLSTDLRRVQSSFDPQYRSNSNLYSLALEWKLGDALTLSTLSSYNKDRFENSFYAFNAVPTSGFNDTPVSPGGVITDPQLGASPFIDARGLTRNNSRQYSQEVRLQSAFSGPVNFSVGGIYLDYKLNQRVIFLGNPVTAAAQILNATTNAGIYIDPLQSPDETGHNYYANSSPYRLQSAAAFGEMYWQATDTLKATLGLRYTNDLKKQVTLPVVLLMPGAGFPSVAPQSVRFQEVTGRATVDWSPKLSFTDDSLFYASVSRGYKGGGFNPGGGGVTGVPPTFKPEFVNAIEIGTKNTLLDRKLVFNLTGFIYDYKGYQVAKLVNQTVANENVDARIKGLEMETIFEPVDNLRFNANVGYLDTKIKSGNSIDLFDPTQGDPNLAVVKSADSGSFGSTCVVPVAEAAGLQAAINAGLAPPVAMASLCTGPFASPNAFPGVPVNLKGKQLPSAPHWTLSFGGEYKMAFGDEWSGTVRADYYWQSGSYVRVYNSIADRLPSYDNLNLSYRIESREKGVAVMLYARNLLSQQTVISSIASDSTIGPSRTVSGKERRSYGIILTKTF